MKRIALVMLAIILAVSVPAAQDLERLFKAAVNEELINRNCKAAIEQYKKVAAGSNRALVAQALFRMAGCYRQLGDAEAQKVYRRLVDEFADQAIGRSECRPGQVADLVHGCDRVREEGFQHL